MNLPIVSCAEMRRIEQQTFASGVSAESLMEEVGRQVAEAVLQTGRSGTAVIVYGKGNNGGDALVAARYLAGRGWSIDLVAQEADEAKLSELTRKNLNALRRVKVPATSSRIGPRAGVILDGLLGTGATGPLREEISALTRQINACRAAGDALVFAVDIPTGLDADTGAADPDCVVADWTVTAGFAKNGLVADGAAAFVGRLCVAALPDFEPHAPIDAPGAVATPDSLRDLLPRRNFESYKNKFGRIAIVAGSPGFTGAPILCSTGALRGGAGLVTVYAAEDIYPLVAATAPAEVMVHCVKSYEEILDEKFDVLALGPGLGKQRSGAILQLIEQVETPMVLDADGLNVVAELDPGVLHRCAGPRLLTPHPGEMARLFPEAKKLSRHETATQFTSRFAGDRFPLTLLLKGSRTIIHQPGKPASYNTTGNPGMGTGGMGDVLTGVCAALIGQHLEPYDAARTGAWLCGRAAEIAVRSRSEESLAALDVPAHLGAAFRDLRSGSV